MYNAPYRCNKTILLSQIARHLEGFLTTVNLYNLRACEDTYFAVGFLNGFRFTCMAAST